MKRLFFSAVFLTLLSGCASESLPEMKSNVVSKKEEQSEVSGVKVLDGYLNREELKEQYSKLVESGIDTTENYKWEFRFQGRIMSSLEDFAQWAHIFDFWPVALESSIDGEMYWLYIQKTDVYSEEKFVKEVSTLFEMAKKKRLSRFDGFSVDYPESK